MEAFDKAKADGHAEAAAHVKSLRLPGFYRSCIYKWKKQRQAEHWTLICANNPRLAKCMKELPNSIRLALGHKKKFDHRSKKGAEPDGTSILPRAFKDAIAEIVASCLQNAYVIFSLVCFFEFLQGMHTEGHSKCCFDLGSLTYSLVRNLLLQG
jgi:hypothetical protein